MQGLDVSRELVTKIHRGDLTHTILVEVFDFRNNSARRVQASGLINNRIAQEIPFSNQAKKAACIAQDYLFDGSKDTFTRALAARMLNGVGQFSFDQKANALRTSEIVGLLDEKFENLYPAAFAFMGSRKGPLCEALAERINQEGKSDLPNFALLYAASVPKLETLQHALKNYFKRNLEDFQKFTMQSVAPYASSQFNVHAVQDQNNAIQVISSFFLLSQIEIYQNAPQQSGYTSDNFYEAMALTVATEDLVTQLLTQSLASITPGGNSKATFSEWIDSELLSYSISSNS